MSDLADCILECDMVLYKHKEHSSNIQNKKLGASLIQVFIHPMNKNNVQYNTEQKATDTKLERRNLFFLDKSKNTVHY